MIITFEELQAFLDEEFPQGAAYGTLQKLGDGWAEMKLEVDEEHLRPGGTVSGPAMMGLADVTLYAALLSKIGLVPLAVTTNLNINFLRKPVAHQPIWARATMLKVGRTMGVGEVFVYSEVAEEPVAHSTMTYSIPPNR
ncbi:phenylacetic acid degradation protein [Marinobacter adhaerens]|uniref:Thioesterase n=1 Tax=Marinobacter salsuginis TaxID=418719 RepID=A0A5M3PQD0_9GAMM|nr:MULTISPECIES: PaaI family thioesterase [Marinobacter]ODM30341.1 phenylacetic acid degradation protein [Marinobacter adhaerens]GBO85068.1 thioesterase [Marinobacter salsuginis]|tara:strand:- start:2640 stop:3056 length:417 start_codon:yes stop_codon:yes gene_type:complete